MTGTGLIAGLLLALVVLASAEFNLSPAVENVTFDDFRLPKHVIPSHYRLYFDVTETDRIKGAITIEVDISKENFFKTSSTVGKIFGCFGNKCTHTDDGFAQNKIVLNKDAKVKIRLITYKELTKDGKEKGVKVLGLEQDPDKQLVAVKLAKNLKPGSKGRLIMLFEAPYSDTMHGVYLRKYPNKGESTENRYVASMLQPTNARTVFPCFDEPEMKAKFSVFIAHPKDEIAVSNTMVNTVDDTTYLTHTFTSFKETPRMSVHMIGFVVGKFERVQQPSFGKSQFPVSFYTPPGLSKYTDYAFKVARKAIDYMEDYADYLYPLNKLDFVLLYDHERDNTEHWGMPIIRANLSLIDEESRDDDKITVTVNVAHVIAHQWFANLITTRWWDTIWITESIAAQKAFEVVLDMFPQYKGEYFFRMGILSSVLQKDSHVIQGIQRRLIPPLNELVTSEQISSVYDVLGYTKSSSLVQLWMNELGRDKYRDVLRSLIRKRAFGSIDLKDITDSFAEVLSINEDYLKGFQTQLIMPGYPIIQVDLDDKQRVTIQQTVEANLGLTQAFGDATGEHETSKIVATAAQPDWFDVANENHWFKLNPNPDLSSYYRVLYSDKVIETSFKNSIERKYLSPIDRLNVLDDAVGLTLIGQMQPTSFRKLVEHYKNEDNGGVILEMLVASQVMSALNLTNSANQSPIANVFARLYQRYGFDAPPTNDFVELRAQMSTLSALVSLGNQQVISDALKKFDANDGIVPELYSREAIYAAVVGYGTAKQEEKMVKHLEETNSYEEQVRLVTALTRTRNPYTLKSVANWLKRIPFQKEHANRLYSAMRATKLGKEHLTDYKF